MDDFLVLGNSFDNCLEKFEISIDKMRGDQLSTQLGKVPFYGIRGYCTRTSDFSKRNRGRQSKD